MSRESHLMNRNHKVRLKNLTVIADDSHCFAAIANCKSAALSAIGAGSKLLCSSSLSIAMGLSCSHQAFAVDSYITFSQNRAGVNNNCLSDISSTAASADLIATGCNSKGTQPSMIVDTNLSNQATAVDKTSSITANSINSRSKAVIDSTATTDAVSGSQLTALRNDLGGAINKLGYKINEVKDNANAGISAAMAMSSIPQSFLPGRSLIGGGITTYNGENAVAIGLSTVSKSGQWVIKANGTADSQGNTGGAVGAGFHF